MRKQTTQNSNATVTRAQKPESIAARLNRAGGRFLGLTVTNTRGSSVFNAQLQGMSDQYVTFRNTRNGNVHKVKKSSITAVSGI